MPGRYARLALHLGPNEIGLALSRVQADHPRLVDRLLLTDSGRDGHGLLKAVDDLLKSTQTPLSALEAIAFAAGPGGFSRVRVACALAQGLALASRCQVVPVGSLLALAQAAVTGGGRGSSTAPSSGLTRVVALVDARMQEIYCASYLIGSETHGPSNVTIETKPALVKLNEIQPLLSSCEQGSEPLVACGDAWHRYDLTPPGTKSWARLDPLADEIAAACIALTDTTEWTAPAQAGPIYLREKVALNIAEQAALRARNASASARP